MSFLYSQLFVRPAYPDRLFNGQTVIVTGSNTGLGREAARHFARLGAARVILAVRNTGAGEAARADIERTTRCAPGTVEVWALDLGRPASVAAFAARADRELDRLDVLCENAGVATSRRRVVPKKAAEGQGEGEEGAGGGGWGHETTIAVNVLGTFLLALLLLPALRETARRLRKETTLSVVSSGAHGHCAFPEGQAGAATPVFEALDASEDLSERYPVSKLLEVLVVRQLAPRLAGSGVVLNLVSPGLCHSELAREAGLSLRVTKFFLARSTEVGSRTLVAAAAAGGASHGKYMSDGVVREEELSPFVRSADGDRAAERVWGELVDILEEAHPGVTKNI